MNIITELLRGIEERRVVNELIRYIASPIINRTEDITNLVSYYADFYPKFDDEKRLKPKFVAEQLFKNYKTERQKLARLTAIIRRASPLIKKFFIHKQLDKKEFTKYQLLIASYEERNLVNLYEVELRDIRKKVATKKIYGEQLYYTKYQFDKEYYFDAKRPIKDKIELYDKLVANLNYHYYLAKLKLVIDRNFATFNEKDLENVWLEEDFIQAINRELALIVDPQDAPINAILLQIYFNIYKTQTNLQMSNEDIYGLYLETKSLLEEYDAFIAMDEKEPIFHFLLNILGVLLNKVGAGFTDETFELYRLGLKLQVIIVHGQLGENHYFNIVHLALNLNKLNWLLEDFSDKYLILLNEKQRKDAIILTKAFVHFHLNDFKLVYDLILNTNFSTRLLDLRARVVKLKAAYKLNKTDVFDSAYNSFRLFLHRNNSRFGNDVIERNKNFILLMTKLERERTKCHTIYNYDKAQAKHDLIRTLKEQTSIVDYMWLTKEVNNL